MKGFVEWPKDFVNEYISKGYWENIPLGEAFDRVVEVFPDKEALVFNNERFRYSQIKTISDLLAVKFLRSGLRPLDRVVVHMPNIPEFIFCYYAFLKIGVIPVMCLPAHRYTEIEYIARKCEAKGYLIADYYRKFDYQELATELQKAVPSLQNIYVAGQQTNEGFISVNNLLKNKVEENEIKQTLNDYKPNPSEVAVLLLSGGTTGLPKIIPRTHNDYLYTTKTTGLHMGISKYTIFLAIAPLAHNFPLACPGIMGVFLRGGKVILNSNTDTESLFTIVEKEKVNLLTFVPAILVNFLNYEKRDDFNISSLGAIVCGGSKLNPEVAKRVKPELGCDLIQSFGMAEGLVAQTDNTTDSDRITIETNGRPVSPGDEIKVIGEDGEEVQLGEIGELICRGPYTIRGYYDAPDHNKNAFTDDGFYKTGDLVRIDHESGCLIIEGRIKDLINRGGEKINAEEIENLILAHPKVLNIAAVAMPDPVMGEKVCACVILKDGQSLTFDELNSFLRQKQIAKFKLPERLEIVDTFPLTKVGKVSKQELRQYIQQKLQEEAS